MHNPPYNLTDQTLTVVIDGRPEVIHSDNAAYERAIAILGDDSLTLDETVDALKSLTRPLTTLTDVDDSRVTVEGRRVLFDGENIPTALSEKLVSVARAGLDLAPWKRFTIRLFSNPSRGAQAELNEFLERGNLPITEDGCFLAYKRVSEAYRDLHSNTFDNSVGAVCEMPREDVDSDRTRTCSKGLHFCSQHYLRSFFSGGGRIVIVKVDPADVVSIPNDYQFTKGRTWRYEVVGEVELDAETAEAEWGVYDDSFVTDWDGTDDPMGWDYDDEDYDDEDYEDDEDEAPADLPLPDPASVSRLEWLRAKFRR